MSIEVEGGRLSGWEPNRISGRLAELFPYEWYGATDVGTSPIAFYYELDNSNEVHHDQFLALSERIMELTQVVDGNGDRVLERVYFQDGLRTRVVVFRFTSDWSYRRWNAELVALGSALGRGTFDPWGNSADFSIFIAQE